MGLGDRIARILAPDMANTASQVPALIESIGELAEAVTLQERKLEDAGWSNLNGDDPLNVKELRKECLKLWKTNSLAWYTATLMKVFVFGSGISKPKARDEKIQKYIDDLWADPGNQKYLFGLDSAGALSDKLLYEGELSIALYPSTSGLFTTRVYDADEIADVILSPQDRGSVIGYKRTYKAREFDFAAGRYKPAKTVTVYHPDTANPNPEKVSEFTGKAFVYRMAVGTDVNDPRGYPPLGRAKPWLKEHSKFMERRCAIQAAVAAYAHKLTTKGGSKSIDAARSALQSTLATGGGIERNPPPAASVWLQNEAVQLEQMKFDTGGANAKEDLRALLMMVGLAMGWLPHYLGDLETANLSTAEKVELITQKMIEYTQNWWADHYKNLIYFGLMKAKESGAYELPIEVVVEGEPASWRLVPTDDELDLTIDIDFPPVAMDAVGEVLSALGTAVTGGFMRKDKAAEVTLRTLRDNNVAEELQLFQDEAAERAAEEAKKAEADAAFQLKLKTAMPANPAQMKSVAKEALVELVGMAEEELIARGVNPDDEES